MQGLTEFLPISSSAHLILLPRLAGWQDQGLVYDIAAHIGTLIAVLYYFRSEIKHMLMSWYRSFETGQAETEARMVWYLIIATIPVAIFGLVFYDVVATAFRNPLIIAWATIIFGLLLLVADYFGKKTVGIQELNLKNTILVGLAQALALIPGTSRSGITMTAGLFLGFDRNTTARFSFYLSIPTILLAGGHEIFRFIVDGAEVNIPAFVLVIVVSAASALLAIHLFLGLLSRTGMLPYVIYRLFLGAYLFYVFYQP